MPSTTPQAYSLVTSSATRNLRELVGSAKAFNAAEIAAS